jgi:hypothetical protein
MKIGFTGTQKGMSLQQGHKLYEMLCQLNPKELHHGDCIGSDREANEFASMLGIKIVIHPPLDPKKRAWCRADVILLPKEYLERNHDIVNSTDFLIATPADRTNRLRSGTWATIRYAAKIGKEIHIL